MDCHAKTMTLAMPGLSRLEWRGTLDYIPSRVLSFIKAQRMVEKGHDAYLAFVRDISADTHNVESVLVVRDFPDVFPVDVPGVPHDWDIDFGIDLVPESFLSIAATLTRLTQKGAPFRWSNEFEESFQKLKTALTTTPVLVLLSASSSYTVYCDVSQISIRFGGIISMACLARYSQIIVVYITCLSKKDLNFRHRRWLELLKDSDITILYHLGKANVVTDALSGKAESMGSLACIPAGERPLALDVQVLDNQFVRLDISEPSRVLACVVSRSSLYECIRECQYDDFHLLVIRDMMQHDDSKEVSAGYDVVLRMQGQICMPNIDGLHEMILEEAHSSRYSIRPGATKMYPDSMQHYWWRRMKKDMVEYVARCLICQQVKYEH
ncbi:uncharacterized protein [Nicotiana tomentosiformis]|uniref:uncharacterized protein n=1 Tax=Nicotiana tomentosiformis TaxID=4098 RepID=UPI00388CCFDF